MFSTDDFAQALENYDYSFEVGQVVSGRVAVVDRDRAEPQTSRRAARRRFVLRAVLRG